MTDDTYKLAWEEQGIVVKNCAEQMRRVYTYLFAHGMLLPEFVAALERAESSAEAYDMAHDPKLMAEIADALVEMNRRRPEEREVRPFCGGCDHGVVGGKVCELCAGSGYKERRKRKPDAHLQRLRELVIEARGMMKILDRAGEYSAVDEFIAKATDTLSRSAPEGKDS